MNTALDLELEDEGNAADERFDKLARHGMPIAGVDVRIVDELGEEVQWDGDSMGEWVLRMRRSNISIGRRTPEISSRSRQWGRIPLEKK